MLFLSVLLFIVLSSGSLQCALNCYDREAGYTPNKSLAVDCHPLALALEQRVQTPDASFCYHCHSSSEVASESVLQSISGGQLLAISSSKWEFPDFRSAEPVEQTFAILALNMRDTSKTLPLSQKHKQLRSTILLV